MEIKKYKKMLWLIPMIGLLIAVPFIGRTMAYLTDNEKQTNTVEFSNVEAKIIEEFHSGQINRNDNIVSYDKEIIVKNTSGDAVNGQE